jgi:hypothetical protein
MGFIAHDIADWLDEQRRISDRALDDVLSDPGVAGFYWLAHGLKFSMSIGHGFWDILRLGQGIQSGAIGGFANDGLRLLSVVPVGSLFKYGKTVFPALTEAKAVARAMAPQLFQAGRYIRPAAGPTLKNIVVQGAITNQCTMVTGVRVMSVIANRGNEAFMTVAELVQGMGISPGARATVKQLSDFMFGIGFKGKYVDPIPDVLGNAKQAEQILKGHMNAGDVAIISIAWPTRPGITSLRQAAAQNAGEAHAVTAYLDNAGKLKIVDQLGLSVFETEGFSQAWQTTFKTKGAPVPNLEQLTLQTFAVIHDVKPFTGTQMQSMLPGLIQAGAVSSNAVVSDIRQNGNTAPWQVLSRFGLPIAPFNFFDKATATEKLKQHRGR